MLAWFLGAIWFAALVGGVLLAVGLRGRVSGCEPVCRRCGFDLRGRFPWGEPTVPTCPDCGEPLLTHRSVRTGVRVRRGAMVSTGCVLAFPAALLVMLALIDLVAAPSLAVIKPTRLIATQVAGSTRASASLRELTARIAAGRAGTVDTVR